MLEAAGRKFGIGCTGTSTPGAASTTRSTAAMMPEDGLDQIRGHDAIFLGAVGFPGVPDHVSLWGLLIPIRREFQQYVNLRPGAPHARRDLPARATASPATSTSGSCARTTRASTRRSAGACTTAPSTRWSCSRALGLHAQRHRPHPALRLRAGAGRARRSTSPRPPSPTASPSRCRSGTSASRRSARSTPTCRRRPVPHRHPDRALRAAPGLVRRGGGLEPLRRHPLRPRARRAPGTIGIAPSAQHQPRARVSRRCSSRCTARAPDIAGQDIANPIGQIWSGAMMLEHLGHRTRPTRS